MSTDGTTRREFLKRFARQAGYAVPLVHTIAAPERLSAQPAASQKMGGMTMGGMTMTMLVAPASIGENPSDVGPQAPWWADPPGGGG